jgi:hypothetical protein
MVQPTHQSVGKYLFAEIKIPAPDFLRHAWFDRKPVEGCAARYLVARRPPQFRVHQFARGIFHMRRLHLVFRRFRFIFATGARGDAIGTPPSGAAKCALFLKFGTVGEDGNNSNRG